MVYISDGGEVVRNHLASKEMLDTLRLLCKGKTAPLSDLCRELDTETKHGKDMRQYSALLGEAISSIRSISFENLSRKH